MISCRGMASKGCIRTAIAFSCITPKNISTIAAYSCGTSRVFPRVAVGGLLLKGFYPSVKISAAFFSSFPPHVVVPMPALSPTMETGSIARWNLKEGDKFEAGTAICEVETDKATVTFDATEEGYLAKILVGTGEIKVGQPIMVTVEDKESVAALSSFSLGNSPAPTPVPAAVAPPAPVPVPVSVPAAVAAPSSSSSSSLSTASAGRVFASPLAKKLAREAGLDLGTVVQRLGQGGSGPNGRLIAEDVLRAAALPASAPVAVAAAQPPIHTPATAAPTSSSSTSIPSSSSSVVTVPGQFSDFPLGDLSIDLAAKFTKAKQVVPHYYLSVDLDLTELLALREKLNGTIKSGSGGRELSVMDFLVKAAALAMKQVPDVNASWMDTFVRRFEQVDINLVMSAGGVTVAPVVKDVSSKGLSAIAGELSRFEESLFSADAASQGSVDLRTGTFTIHNLGMYGVKSAAPIVLPPQACALALGSITDTVVPAADGAEVAWRVSPVVTATLSCDHRVVDGAVGAQWLAAFKALAENPMAMIL